MNEDVHHQPQGPQGRAVSDRPMIYTVVQLMPIEAYGRLRYRIKSKSENIERAVKISFRIVSDLDRLSC